jgi:hypothetical protein
VGDLGDHIGSDPFVNRVLGLGPEAPGLVGVGLGEDPLQGKVAVQGIAPASSRASRIRSMAMFRTPGLRRMTSVICSVSAWSLAANAGSFSPVRISWIAYSRSVSGAKVRPR